MTMWQPGNCKRWQKHRRRRVSGTARQIPNTWVRNLDCNELLEGTERVWLPVPTLDTRRRRPGCIGS